MDWTVVFNGLSILGIGAVMAALVTALSSRSNMMYASRTKAREELCDEIFKLTAEVQTIVRKSFFGKRKDARLVRLYDIADRLEACDESAEFLLSRRFRAELGEFVARVKNVGDTYYAGPQQRASLEIPYQFSRSLAREKNIPLPWVRLEAVLRTIAWRMRKIWFIVFNGSAKYALVKKRIPGPGVYSGVFLIPLEGLESSLKALTHLENKQWRLNSCAMEDRNGYAALSWGFELIDPASATAGLWYWRTRFQASLRTPTSVWARLTQKVSRITPRRLRGESDVTVAIPTMPGYILGMSFLDRLHDVGAMQRASPVDWEKGSLE